ncbi:beta-lactamase family protein [Rhizobium sp. VS19-DR104.2]|uniref:serine hydrolase domain-containing protein n=1 Tax=unclassified Rhizobium TaxID=2613769 RepID=UPI001CC5BD24|nr:MULTISPECIES: serine hydrolase [unclassified Rhizobium]MBZ5762936.1 beta-lactamase family protein [Rhizobium sp. VS19-DR96]MBZ5768769.1 beta-lactamase family protein [Rhizobium sp. VS19-DR129.2]MBZ5776385.1 beta-lactamase family protein [Rhizobium sp. VS19-DRK62.2]MBZ5787592.1 beta-lactamase family protein [Rhizobium sp. VS19-DR121]MBZ5804947.1 beta-lactamase family protein [Rhizobium sp. VS19-DR181]
MQFKRSDVTLANWRNAPHSRWSFQNVSEIVPSATIIANRHREDSALSLGELSDLNFGKADADALSLEAFLQTSETDELVVMKRGRIVAEWLAPHRNPAQPHIIFSVSKSLTGLLAGVLAGKGLLSFDRPIVDYMPEVAGSAYADATVQQLFDMEISTDFIEDYLDSSGGFDRYRRSTGWNPDKVEDPALDLKSFICTIGKGEGEHGEKHAYRSPDTDLAGIVLERAGGDRFATLMGGHLWRPMSARSDAMVTVDRIGTARAAGGISATARDLARLGELVRTGGSGIVAEAFIAGLWTDGNRMAWKNGDQADLFPEGSYRNCWYETGGGEIAAIGIHGQWIWVDPAHETVIVKLSSQTLPVDPPLDQTIIRMLRALSHVA